MYKKDYHPDESIVFDTKNYGFTSPKSTGLEPLSNALVQIDAALKKEETDRITEDIRINKRVDKEIVDRTNADNTISEQLKNLENAAMRNIGAISAIKWSGETELTYVPTFKSKDIYYTKINYVQGTDHQGEEFVVYLPQPTTLFLPAIPFVKADESIGFIGLSRKTSLDQNNLYAYGTGNLPAIPYKFANSFWIQFTK